jgi:protein SCO1/2
MIKKFRLIFIPIILVFSLIGVFIFTTVTKLERSKCSPNLIAGGKSTIGGNFSLIDESGTLVDSKQVIIKPSLIYFGYSYCPDVCPFDLQRNSIAVDILDEIGIDVSPVFITIDPDRDTAERMKEFTTFLHPKMIGLTGSKKQILDAMRKFKVYGEKATNNFNNDEYLMDHSAFTYLVDPNLGFLDYFNRDVSSEEMAERVACFAKKS